MLRTYQTPTIEQVGGSDYELRAPVFFVSLLAVVAAAIAVGLALVYDIYRAVTRYDVEYMNIPRWNSSIKQITFNRCLPK